MQRLQLAFQKKNGKTLRGLMYTPEDLSRQYPLAIFCHGFGSCAEELMHHGPGFTRKGICCLFPDFCGGGPHVTSDGDMLDMSVETECQDLTETLEYIKVLPYIDQKQIYLMGESQGGLVAALVAARSDKEEKIAATETEGGRDGQDVYGQIAYPSTVRQEIKGCVLWYPGFIIPQHVARMLDEGIHDIFHMPVGRCYIEDGLKLKPYEEVADYQKPVLIIHGDQDQIVPIEYSHRAVACYPDAKLVTIAGARHGFDGDDSFYAEQLSIDFCSNRKINQNYR